MHSYLVCVNSHLSLGKVSPDPIRVNCFAYHPVVWTLVRVSAERMEQGHKMVKNDGQVHIANAMPEHTTTGCSQVIRYTLLIVVVKSAGQISTAILHNMLIVNKLRELYRLVK